MHWLKFLIKTISWLVLFAVLIMYLVYFPTLLFVLVLFIALLSYASIVTNGTAKVIYTIYLLIAAGCLSTYGLWHVIPNGLMVVAIEILTGNIGREFLSKPIVR